MDPLTILLITAPIWAILCAIIANSKSRSAGGWAFAGILFGPLAFLLVLLSGKARVSTETVASSPSARSRDPFASRKP